MSGLKLFLLGSPRLERDGEPLEIDARKSMALLAYLVVTEESRTREALSTLLWPESEPGRGRAILRRNLSVLRKTLAGDWLTVSRDTIGIDPDADVWLDVRRFRHLLQTWKTHGHPLKDVCPDCLADLGQAVQLYKGDLMEGFTLRDSVNFDDWQLFEAEGLRQELASALERLVRGHDALDQHKAAIPYARRWVALDPLHEPARRHLMEAYAGAGQCAAALSQYQDCVRVLDRELGLPPGPETTSLYRSIRDRLRRDTLSNGQIIAGQFALVETAENLLGRGGMGRVYQGTDIRSGESVAIKMLESDLIAGQPDLVARFVREGEVLGKLDHPNIVKLLAAAEQDGQHYLVMEYASGSLRDLLAEQGTLPVHRVLDIALDLADALTRTHRLKIVHRDLKPGNVLLTGDGTPRLTDFGLARLADGRDLTQTGALLGTSDYLSPEVCRGQAPDAQSDIWAFGVLLYEMLSGQRPFRGESQAATLNAILTQPPPDLAGLCSGLGIEIPPALGDLVARMLKRDPAERIASMRLVGAELEAIQADRPLTPVAPAAPSGLPPACPYRGLFAFREEDAPFFFGREAYAGRLKEVVEERPLVAVVGPSGSGKSSVVHAGLLPHLQRQGSWLIVTFRPGGQPLQALVHALLPLLEPDLSETERLVETRKLAEALRYGELPLSDVVARILEKQAKSARLLLVVDQFEEVYTLCPKAESRLAFLDALLEPVLLQTRRARPDLALLLALRADFWEQALAYRPLADSLQDADLILGSMTREELERAVENPAQKQGVDFEAGLVERILDDVGEEPGSLPLLEFALTSLWDHENAWNLSHDGYEAIGRVQGALTRHADEVYGGLSSEEQLAARHIFTQLVRPGEGTEDTRRLAHRNELGDSDWRLVQVLADARLVVTGRDAEGQETVEVAHEALITGWGRLRDWMQADRAFRGWQERLRAALRNWQASGKDEGALLRGAPLAEAEGWLAERASSLRPAEQAFIDAGVALREKRQVERERQRQRELALERRGRRLLAIVAGVLAVAVVATVAIAAYSLLLRRQALEAYSLSLAANAREVLDSHDTVAALELALEANQISNPPLEAQRILMDAAYSPGARWGADLTSLFADAQGPAISVALSPDGHQALLGLADGAIILWDLQSKQEVLRLRGHAGQVNDLTFTLDGLKALSGGADAQVILWDLGSGTEIRRFGAGGDGHSGPVRAVDIDPGGRMAVSGGLAATSYAEPGELILWDLETGNQVRQLQGHGSGVVAARFAPDGRSLLASSGDALLLTDLGTGADDQELNPYGLYLWSTDTGELIQAYEVGEQDVYTLATSPDGTKALTGSYYYNTLSLWDLESGEVLHTFDGHRQGVQVVAFTPDGQRALSGSYDDGLILWDLSSGQPIVHLNVHQADVLDLAVAPDGRSVLSSAADGALVLSDLSDGAEARKFEGHGDMVWDVAIVPHKNQMLSVSGPAGPGVPLQDCSIRLWDLETGAQLRAADVDLQYGTIFQVAVSPDASTALIAAVEPFVRVWDLDSWEEIGRLEGHAAEVTGIEFTPDGQRALSSSVDGTLILWDVPRREIIRRMAGPEEGFWGVAISPDGRTALSDSRDSSLILWDLETGQPIRSFVREDQPGATGGTGAVYLSEGRTALSGDDDGTLIEWDLETGKELRRLGQHPGLRARVIVSPDERLALSSAMDGSLMLWDLESGELIRRTEGHGIIFDLAAGPDGQTALFGSSDTIITQWRLQNPSLEALKAWVSANRTLPGLTCAQREAYQIKPLCDPESW